MKETTEKRSLLPPLLPSRSILFLLIFLIGSAVTGKELADISNWWSVAATLVNIVTVAAIVLLARKSGQSYKELINYKKGGRSVKKTILLVYGFVCVGMGGMYAAGFMFYGKFMPKVSVDIVAPIPAALAVINLILLPLTVPFAEDGLYLGCGVGKIRNSYAAVIISAFFYALQHCFIPTMFDAKYMLYRFVSFLPAAVLFCVYFRKKKDPFAIMISHAILDLATGVMIMLTSVVPGLYDSWQSMV
ncbi:MAG: CPBP family intramembrane metalloprotease [Ruminococcus sp.]|nr:CPBP family intramembrane metalloprotease [Ruminococcus sp.]